MVSTSEQKIVNLDPFFLNFAGGWTEKNNLLNHQKQSLDLQLFDADGKSSKHILPNGGLMVIFTLAKTRKSTLKNTSKYLNAKKTRCNTYP